MNKLKEERDAHDQAANALEQLSTRMALCAATEESATAQIRYVKEAVLEYRKTSQKLVYTCTLKIQ